MNITLSIGYGHHEIHQIQLSMVPRYQLLSVAFRVRRAKQVSKLCCNEALWASALDGGYC